MPTKIQKPVATRFPLRLTPSVRRSAEAFSAKEGVSLNQFINLAVAEKLGQLRHEEWAENRRKPTAALAKRALSLLDRAGDDTVEPGDELPRGYRRK